VTSVLRRKTRGRLATTAASKALAAGPLPFVLAKHGERTAADQAVATTVLLTDAAASYCFSNCLPSAAGEPDRGVPDANETGIGLCFGRNVSCDTPAHRRSDRAVDHTRDIVGTTDLGGGDQSRAALLPSRSILSAARSVSSGPVRSHNLVAISSRTSRAPPACGRTPRAIVARPHISSTPLGAPIGACNGDAPRSQAPCAISNPRPLPNRRFAAAPAVVVNDSGGRGSVIEAEQLESRRSDAGRMIGTGSSTAADACPDCRGRSCPSRSGACSSHSSRPT